MRTGDLTALDHLIRAEIEASGPMTISRFMQLCLSHPQHGYYQKADPLGKDGDFTTAPEISQLFGELVAAWLTDAWQQLGAPSPCALVELGPGRGTLMADMLRTARHLPGLPQALEIHLVETSPALRAKQRQTLEPFGVTANFHDDLTTLPELPALWVANEFFDALPTNQWQKSGKGWHTRKIALGQDNTLTLGLEPTPLAAPKNIAGDAPEASILEHSPAQDQILAKIAEHAKRHGGAGLIIDYGSLTPGFGDTLQAVKKHTRANPLEACGTVDLTTHVDFAHLRAGLEARGLMSAATDQGSFLLAMGLLERAGQLGAGQSGDIQESISLAVERLAGDAAMGKLFKVLAFASQPILLHGFATHTQTQTYTHAE